MENQIIELLDALFGQEQVYMWSTYILPNGHFLNPENYTEDPEFEPVYEHEDFLYPFRDNYHDVDLFLLMKVIDKYCIKMNVTYPYLYLPENRITDKQLKAIENILLNHLVYMEPMEYDGLMILTPKSSEKLYSWEELLDVKQVLRDIKMFYVTGVLESNNRISKNNNTIRYHGATLDYTIWEDNNEPYIFIDYIRVPNNKQGKGYASKLLKRLLDYADKRSMLVQLEVPEETYDDTGLTIEELDTWYKRYGFEYHWPYYSREPQNNRNVLESNKRNTKLLLRFIGPMEHNKLLNGEEIRALK